MPKMIFAINLDTIFQIECRMQKNEKSVVKTVHTNYKS